MNPMHTLYAAQRKGEAVRAATNVAANTALTVAAVGVAAVRGFAKGFFGSSQTQKRLTCTVSN